MNGEHRREVYSPTSPDALQAPDATGPDGVRVTLRVEPAIDRFRRWRFKFFTPHVITDPVGTYLQYRLLPNLVQKHVLRDRWAVAVEADSGEHCLVKATSRDDATSYARLIHDGVQAQGVAFLRTFTK